MHIILTTGRLGEEFAKTINKSGNEFDVVYVEKPTTDDLNRVNCLAAFSAPDLVSISELKWIHSFGAGVENFLQRRDLNPRTILTRTVGNLGLKMGEFCLNHMLNYFHDTYKLYENNKNREWEFSQPESLIGKNVLLLGTGEMAAGIVQVLHPLRIECIGVNTKGKKSSTSFLQCITFNQIPDIAKRISCVINTLPFTKDTDALLNSRFFGHFDNILFINVGRGRSVVVNDLIHAINNSRVSFAVLDVFEQEPLPIDSPLWKHPKIFISPHCSAVTDVGDILDSFLIVHKLMKENRRNHLFVDFEKGY